LLGIRLAIVVALATMSITSDASADGGGPGVDAMGYEDTARFASDAAAWVRSFCEDRGRAPAACEIQGFEEALRDLTFGLTRNQARAFLSRCTFEKLIGKKGEWADQVAATERCFMQRILKEWK